MKLYCLYFISIVVIIMKISKFIINVMWDHAAGVTGHGRDKDRKVVTEKRSVIEMLLHLIMIIIRF